MNTTLIDWKQRLRQRWGMALLVWLGVVGAAVGASLLLPPQFEATASLVLDVKPDPIAGAFPAAAANSLINTQVDVLQSHRVARRVVQNLRLMQNPELRAQWMDETEEKTAFDQWLTDTFMQHLEVRPARDSNVVQVAYRAHDARLAAQMANAFVQAYLDTALELRVDPARQFSSFFDDRSLEARRTLEQAQARLSAFQKQEGLLETDARIDVENNRLTELSTQVLQAQAQSADSGSRLQQVRSHAPETLPEVLNSSLISNLKAELARQQSRLKELDARLGQAHPQRQEMLDGMAELESRLAAEVHRITSGLSTQNAINQNRMQRLQSALAAQREQVLKMKAARDQAAVLTRDVESAQRAYDAVVGRLQLTRLESQTPQAQAYWLAQATPPARPISPKLWLNTLLAILIGSALAVLVVYWARVPTRQYS
jgi:succinoglycan biosynthesis transport protein ExoP